MALKNLIKSLESNDITYIGKLKRFANTSITKTSFPELSEEDRSRFWASLFTKLSCDITSDEIKTILICIRILSRDKTNISQLVTDKRMKILVRYAGFGDLELEDEEVAIEGVKCIYNLLITNRETAKMLWDTNALPKIIKRIKGKKCSYDIRTFDCRLMFLMTTNYDLCCLKIYEESNGFMIYCDLLSRELKLGDKYLNDKQVNFCSEILRILFNILAKIKPPQLNKNDTKNLVCVVRELLLSKTKPPSVNIVLHCTNLITLLPLEHLSNILVPGFEMTDKKSYEAVDVVVQFLDIQLTSVEEEKTYDETENEVLSPVILALHNLANSNMWIRKYIKSKILPNLREFNKRPEEGSTLRNKLCRRLSSPISSINDLVADLIFLLCKGSVSRMVKYTGLGNSAGYFARRGLMSRANLDSKNFSDSDSSDTEEYLENRHLIDPVVGCKTNWKSQEEMSEEQKECLALELVNQIDQLQKLGFFQPCTIDENGRPVPIENILQLQKDRDIDTDEDDNSKT